MTSATKSGTFSDRTISSFESLILECSLENARQNSIGLSNNFATVTSAEMSPADLAELRKLPGNQTCIDCKSDDTEWASISFGIFLCAQCSGHHRALGTHISRVRSVKMDSWTNEQLNMMRQSSNQQCKQFLEKAEISFADTSIRDRYSSAAAGIYHAVLKSRVADISMTEDEDDREDVPSMDASSTSMETPASTSPEVMTGDSDAEKFGTSLSDSKATTVSDLAKASRFRDESNESSADLMDGTLSMRENFVMRDHSMPSLRQRSMNETSMRDSSMRDDSSRILQNFRERFVTGRGVGPSISASSDGYVISRGVGRSRSASSASSFGQSLWSSRRSAAREAPTSRSRLTRSVSASAPTVTYLGRSFRADTFVSRSPSRRSSISSSGVDASCRSEIAVSAQSTEDNEFAKLKASLKDAGAMTSMSIKLKLQDFANYNNGNNVIAMAATASAAIINKDRPAKPPRRPSRRASWLGVTSTAPPEEDEYQSMIVISPIA